MYCFGEKYRMWASRNYDVMETGPPNRCSDPNFWIQVFFGVTTVVFAALFGAYYSAWHDLQGCGTPRFTYSDAIPADLKRLLREDVIAPNGCNACSSTDLVPVWLAPGDLCSMKTLGRLVEHPHFQHCDDPRYVADYDPTHHVKACISPADITYLWNTEPPHCWDGRVPILSKMNEGLLFCEQVTSLTPPSPPSSPPPLSTLICQTHKPHGSWLESCLRQEVTVVGEQCQLVVYCDTDDYDDIRQIKTYNPYETLLCWINNNGNLDSC